MSNWIDTIIGDLGSVYNKIQDSHSNESKFKLLLSICMPKPVLNEILNYDMEFLEWYFNRYSDFLRQADDFTMITIHMRSEWLRMNLLVNMMVWTINLYYFLKYSKNYQSQFLQYCSEMEYLFNYLSPWFSNNELPIDTNDLKNIYYAIFAGKS